MISERAIRFSLMSVDVQLIRRPQVRGHRALGVVGDKDVTATGGALVASRDREVQFDAQ